MTVTVKCISLTQPWASLMALGLKKVETRGWYTSYRGPLAIHAAKRFPPEARRLAEAERALGRLPARLPFGAIIATLQLEDVLETLAVVQSLSGLERLYGDYSDGRFAWFTDKVTELALPIPWRGQLGLFTVEIPE